MRRKKKKRRNNTQNSSSPVIDELLHHHGFFLVCAFLIDLTRCFAIRLQHQQQQQQLSNHYDSTLSCLDYFQSTAVCFLMAFVFFL